MSSSCLSNIHVGSLTAVGEPLLCFQLLSNAFYDSEYIFFKKTTVSFEFAIFLTQFCLHVVYPHFIERKMYSMENTFYSGFFFQ